MAHIYPRYSFSGAKISMASEAQINANRLNATHSTGPRSAEGRETSAKNRLTHGLYTKNDFVLPEETDIYGLFCKGFEQSCNAQDAIEECLAAEIASAAWRLRRCNLADGDIAQHSAIDPLLDATFEKQIRSIERARSHATSVFHRGLNQLKKLQKERPRPEPKEITPPEPEPGLRPEFLQRVQQKLQSINELGSNCKPAPGPARGRACPCKSGKKYKLCCGNNTPW